MAGNAKAGSHDAPGGVRGDAQVSWPPTSPPVEAAWLFRSEDSGINLMEAAVFRRVWRLLPTAEDGGLQHLRVGVEITSHFAAVHFGF